jgi:glycosyltransferase involved in cell wall biosynthesis
MNVIITIDELDMGGAQHIVYELMRHIDTSKYNITIICTDGKVESLLENEVLKLSAERHFSVLFLKSRKFIKSRTGFAVLNKIFDRLRQIFIDIFIIEDLSKNLNNLRPDIIHAHQHGIWAAYWALFHNTPLITTIHTNPQATFPHETEKFIFKLSILFHRNILVGISEYNMHLIQSYWHLADLEVRYVNNGVNIEDYYAKPHEIFSFINVGRQDENKNQSLILRAFARLHREYPQFPMRLFLVGDGVTHDFLRILSGKLGIDNMVTFTGYIKSAVEFLAVSDVYISSAHREGLSLSVLEAMAAGLPIIATDVGGVRDLARENGILIPDNDEDSLYLAMAALRDNDELRLAKGNKSLEMVQAYSVKSMTEEYSAIYDELGKK